MTFEAGTAPVGFGGAAGIPPHVAQVPTATTARALSAILLIHSSAVIGFSSFSPTAQYRPSSSSGIEPSTTSIYLPASFEIILSMTPIARSPAAPIMTGLNSRVITSISTSSTPGYSVSIKLTGQPEHA
ncbi:MAG: hypothetical protein BWY60_00140 [Actinobacteria bacterium ADurb.Bin346]|nr:MAG: hypothetical protein BWY60_00140 [Actinobacteria bacterium ADurb.Bin346]